MKLLIVSDIHGNRAALQAVLSAEGDCDKILCLGGPGRLWAGTGSLCFVGHGRVWQIHLYTRKP